MGLFDKILKEVGDKVPDLNLEELKKNVGEAVNTIKTEAEKAGLDLDSVKESIAAAKEEVVTAVKEESAGKAAGEASGWWGGEEPPAEENLFTFAGTPAQYFEKIFAEDFPGYRVEKSAGWGGFERSTIYTFYEGDRKALVTEVVPDSSEAQKLREKCAKEGVPYLRYYVGHEGWWNTRSYVVERTRKALG